MGLCLLIVQKPGDAAIYWASIGLGLSVPVLAAFVLLQNSRLFAYLEHVSEKLAQSWHWQGLRGLHRSLLATYRRRRWLHVSILLHLMAWVSGAAEAWLGFRLLGHTVGVGAVLAIESLVYALRSVAFFVPSAVGVQEGGYVILGSVYGVPPEAALALSLLKRGREVILGVPGLLAWQWMEGGRLWNRKRADVPSAAEIDLASPPQTHRSG
jgi:putative membrane protein